jgi:hypothetical protein
MRRTTRSSGCPGIAANLRRWPRNDLHAFGVAQAVCGTSIPQARRGKMWATEQIDDQCRGCIKCSG